MLKEFSFIESGTEHHKCYIGLCDEPIETLKPIVEKYWKSHDIDSDDFGHFVFHRNKNNEYVMLTACREINTMVLEYALSMAQSLIGIRCQMPDLLRIIREFDKITENVHKQEN